MNIVSRVELSGLWGSRNLTFDFHRDVNFLIGVNGSGKTTVINIIASALNVDFPTLDRMPFEKLRIELSEVGGNRRPSIEVEKTRREKSPFPRIRYHIREKASDKPTSFTLDEFVEERLIRGMPSRMYYEQMRVFSRGVVEAVRSLVNIGWLSIHRATYPSRIAEERSYESTVDLKLDELATNFIKFFSVLSKRATSETEQFQKTLFLSFISGGSQEQLFSSVKELDLTQEKNALTEIFRELRIPERQFTAHVDRHFQLVADASQHDSYSSDEVAALVTAWRVHSAVQEWHKLTERQKNIFEPRETFIEILNSFLQRKTATINEKNELEFITHSKKKLQLRDLSSGEKQLIILLGEALLQEKEPWVYIADEPELSLHVNWQESLIHNLRRINPKAQIIIATHSPDIVSSFQRNVFDMEKVLS